MALSSKLELRNLQNLQLTPQLLQSIKLLQLSQQDLADYIEAELEQNPFLERNDTDDNDVSPDSSELERASADNIAENPSDWFKNDAIPSTQTLESDLGTEFENIFDKSEDATLIQSFSDRGRLPHDFSASSAEDETSFEQWVSAEENLSEHLLRQLGMMEADDLIKNICRYLIDSLDEAGYLREPLNTIAQSLGVSIRETEEALQLIQSMEPAGIGARDLAECLSLQLREKDHLDPLMQRLIAHLDLFAARDYQKIKKVCGINEEDFTDMLAEIRQLNPRPGSAFSRGRPEQQIPDVIVLPASDGGWRVEVNDETLPRLLVNQSYALQINRKDMAAADKSFLTDALHQASWLVRCLENRTKTILKVAGEIVRQQDAFLTHGLGALRPLTLKQVAEQVELHESTVSRVTAHKTILTPRGIFEMRYFFTNAVSNDAGEDHSAASIRWRIQKIVDEEKPNVVLSDDDIVKILQSEGVEIARRTVAKYRDVLKIPSSVERRRQKILA